MKFLGLGALLIGANCLEVHKEGLYGNYSYYNPPANWKDNCLKRGDVICDRCAVILKPSVLR